MSSKKQSRPNSELEALFRGYVADWAEFFGVTHQWTIHLSFVHAKEMESVESGAEVNWPTAYTSASLKVNIDSWKNNNINCDCDLEEMAAHEMGHLVDAVMWDYICANFYGALRRAMLDAMERQIDTWTRIAIRARYGDDYRCSRCSELHGSDEPVPSEPVESLRGETGDSGGELRVCSASADGSGLSEQLRSRGIRMDNDPIQSSEDS